MKSAPSVPWAKSPPSQRRDPTAAELANGYPCGPFDMQLFNELAYRMFQATREIHTVVTSAGLSPNDDDLTQLWQAIRKKFSIFWGVDGGTKNAIVCDLDPAPDSYTVPMLMVVRKIGVSNDAAMTANFNGLGVADLKDMTGAALSSGALPGNGYQIIMFDGSQFRVLGGSSSYTTISGLTATGGEVIDVAIDGVINANFEKPGYEATFADTDVLAKKKPGGVHKKFTWADLKAALPDGEEPIYRDAGKYKVRRSTTTQIGVVRKATPAEVAARVVVSDKPYVGPEDLPDLSGIGIGSEVTVPIQAPGPNTIGGGLSTLMGVTVTGNKFVTGHTFVAQSAFLTACQGASLATYWDDFRRTLFDASQTWTVVKLHQTYYRPGDPYNGEAGIFLVTFKRTA